MHLVEGQPPIPTVVGQIVLPPPPMTSSFLSQLELVRLYHNCGDRLHRGYGLGARLQMTPQQIDAMSMWQFFALAVAARRARRQGNGRPARSTGRAPKRRRGRGRHKRRSSAIPQAVRRVPSAAAAPRRGSSARRSVRCGLLRPGLNSRGPRQVPAWLRCAGTMCSCSESHLGGSTWLAYDANSGGHATRIHARSIAGYTIVNPHATRVAFAWRV